MLQKIIILCVLCLSLNGFAESLKINLPVTKFKLANGLTVLLHEDHTVPMISYHTWYKVGSKDEAEGVTGAAHMLEHMMFKGAKKYSGKDFDRIMNENGIYHNAFTTYDYTGFYQNLPSSKLELIMEIEVDRMSSLALNPQDLLSEREVVKEERRWRVDNNPMGLLRELSMSTIYKKHPYRWPVIGTMKDISEYSADKLRYFYSTFYVPNNAVLVIAGDFDTSKARSLIEKYYGVLPYKEVPPREYAAEPAQKQARQAELKQEVQTTTFSVSYRAFPEGHPESYALDLASTILGAGSSSRLHKKLVYEKQIATSAYAYQMGMKEDGVFSVGVSMKPGADHHQALTMVMGELADLKKKPVSDEELQKAKTLTMKSVVDSLVATDSKARTLAATEIVTGSFENIFSDLEKYQRVTAADIQKVAAKILNDQQKSVVVLLPKAKK